ncbi:enterotoxin A family protein [Pseudomonas aeruginosa]|uniref:enterotoxin A family protein n=1 Tax=Pseudomonas aeruginosa TaxID=287 RepID=UPI000F835A94|nr:enterotoxin A family protein [Pseudomonas aeruginosa]MBG4922346.1 hypothetical protein [Pseudomonas aeruginosa]MBG5864597.1 hypothetical protein [Pseudomonas aeruginosa]RTX35877.1 hypothetical protein DZA21_11250 [Pseudomonas aeruginosa]HDU8925397.1 hypothetical protein [Pseudomonas aeruginosa]HDU9094056.1 hypothetical protein [Pseudomonas aeruginosa]
MKNIVYLIFLLFGSSVAGLTLADDFLYRADFRTPEQIIEAQAILTRGQSDSYERGTRININLYDHAGGVVTGNTRYDSGYAGTTVSLSGAHAIGQTLFGGVSEYYIYVIRRAPNLIDVNGVLGRYSPHPEENEYAAIGGIALSQIRGWYRVNFGRIEGGMVTNSRYRADLYQNLDVAPVENSYQLAGFPQGHPAWREQPWVSHAPSSSCSQRRELRDVDSEDECSAFGKELALTKLMTDNPLVYSILKLQDQQQDSNYHRYGYPVRLKLWGGSPANYWGGQVCLYDNPFTTHYAWIYNCDNERAHQQGYSDVLYLNRIKTEDGFLVQIFSRDLTYCLDSTDAIDSQLNWTTDCGINVTKTLFKEDGHGRFSPAYKTVNPRVPHYIKGANDDLHVYYGLPYGLLHDTMDVSDDWTVWSVEPVPLKN